MMQCFWKNNYLIAESQVVTGESKTESSVG